MAEWHSDQAAGLRRLVSKAAPRSICFNGGRGGTGASSTILNLAVAMSLSGKRVLILDEHRRSGNIASRLGLAAPMDLEQVLLDRLPLESLLYTGPSGIELMQVSASTAQLARLSAFEEDRLAFEFSQLTSSTDVILIDALAAEGNRVPSFNLASAVSVIVVSNRAESLTDAYAMMKLLNREYGQRQFRVLVNRVDSLAEAKAVFERLTEVSQRFIDVEPKLIGYVPEDDKLAQASRLGQPVVTAFPAADASQAFEQLARSIEKWPPPDDERYATVGFLHRLIQSSRALAEGLNH
ncbi:AAA family ATPase [Chitinivorax sp. PXF-14]|uniref:MinD/ParA family ATP-binding protein n=1 Tax=Chitinivorax sp. PXF-14 TaxID=3230488 RepID=UPI0034670CC9